MGDIENIEKYRKFKFRTTKATIPLLWHISISMIAVHALTIEKWPGGISGWLNDMREKTYLSGFSKEEVDPLIDSIEEVATDALRRWALKNGK